jgi:hypothetical protein
MKNLTQSNQDFLEKLEIFNEFLSFKNQEPVSTGEAKDWGITSESTFYQIEELANEWLSECSSVKCENKNSWMYEV